MNQPEASQEPREVSQVVEHLFRHEGAKMVATLTGIFGVEHLNLAEDVVQEALARALQTWPFHGMPQNPAAWIMRASRNLALDVVRRQKVFRDKEAEIVRLMDRPETAPDQIVVLDQEIADDRLRMMFVCCPPPAIRTQSTPPSPSNATLDTASPPSIRFFRRTIPAPAESAHTRKSLPPSAPITPAAQSKPPLIPLKA